ncbi:MAG TPA: metallopeptidase family protein [Chloroflexota bacterium]|nr:metallopeptidase family protein [Chloroflexota bacterium]
MRRRVRVSRGRFRRYVREALAMLPPRFQAAAENVAIVVERHPSPEDHHLRRSNRGQAPKGRRRREPLFGIYRGIPLPQRSSAYTMVAPDVIAVFRRPLEAACRDRKKLREEIRLTLLHEVGHYFGLDEWAVNHL